MGSSASKAGSQVVKAATRRVKKDKFSGSKILSNMSKETSSKYFG